MIGVDDRDSTAAPNTSREYALVRLLVASFTDAELRELPRRHHRGAQADTVLSNTLVLPSEIATAVVKLMLDRGLIDAAFFDFLSQALPGRESEVRALEADWPAAAPKAVGPTTLGGRYRLLDPIGELGGMGVVWRAVDTQLDRVCVVKLLRPELLVHAAVRQRFAHEARTMARIQHRNVVVIYGFSAENPAYIAMEICEGSSVAARRRQGVLPLAEALDAIEQACDGVSGAHEMGVIHCDIKPENLLIHRDGTIKVADFGIALDPGQSRLTRQGAGFGTPGYMAPEQETESGTVDFRADVYSLAATLVSLITDENPAELKLAGMRESTLERLPEAVRAVVRRATEPSRADRYPDVRTMRQELAGVRREPPSIVELGPSATIVPPLVEPSPPMPRRGWLAAALVLGGVLVLAGGAQIGGILDAGGTIDASDPPTPQVSDPPQPTLVTPPNPTLPSPGDPPEDPPERPDPHPAAPPPTKLAVVVHPQAPVGGATVGGGAVGGGAATPAPAPASPAASPPATGTLRATCAAGCAITARIATPGAQAGHLTTAKEERLAAGEYLVAFESAQGAGSVSVRLPEAARCFVFWDPSKSAAPPTTTCP